MKTLSPWRNNAGRVWVSLNWTQLKKHEDQSLITDQKATPWAVLFSPLPSVVEASWRWRMDLRKHVKRKNKASSYRSYNCTFGNKHTHKHHWPDNREQDGSTTDEVDQEDYILPQVILGRTFLCGLDDDVGHVGKNLEENRSVHQVQKWPVQWRTTSTHLQRDDDHKDLLLLVRQDVFHKSPAGSNQSQRNEEQRPLESAEQYIKMIEKNTPL